MINALFMLGSSYNKERVFSTTFMIGWICYMVVNYDFSLGKIFPIINAGVFLFVSIIINLINNKKINTVLSIFSILIWSIIIDIICYFMFPVMSANQSLVHYIFQGILFNYKYVFVNVCAICVINGIIYIKNLIKNNLIKDKIAV